MRDDLTKTRASKSHEAQNWLPVATGILALASCYGMLVLVAGLGALEISFEINNTLWGTIIILLSATRCLALTRNAGRHGHIAPASSGVLGLAILVWVMLIHYAASLEFVGFGALLGGVLWDRRYCTRRYESR